MSDEKNDFLTEILAQAPAAVDSAESESDTPEAPVPETVETPAPETPEPVAVAPTAPPVEEKTVPLAALKSEREKRQELERRLKELETKPAPERVNFYDNPEEHLNQRFQEIEARATARTYAALEAVEKEAHPDFDEVAAEVIAAAQQHPTLANQIMQAANPAREMYKVGQKLREFQKMQDPEAYRAQVAAEVRAQVLAELGERGAQAAREAEARAAKAAAIPPDISTRTNAPPKGSVTVTNPVNALFPKH
jgi:hypothetical protein